ncbi:MAG: RidA family protein [Alphaproteobacteria bacterium]|nr:RidA family protein [Alphaproteobacteria bacterium]
MSRPELERVPNAKLPSKSSVSVYRFPGGGGMLWAVAASADKSLDFAGQTRAVLAALDGHLTRFGLDRTRVVKAEVVVTDHDNKPAFDAVWAGWMPAGHGPVRSFVESRMPEGDLVEVIITAALPGPV